MVTFKRLLELAGIKLNEHMSADNARKIFTYYGEKPSGDVHELQTQYHRLARSNHPDAGGTVDAMQEINAAYDVLKTAQNPDEEIRRANGSTYEDFSDPEAGYEPHYGMSLRDYFASRAPIPPHSWWGTNPPTCAGFALWNYLYADAMLEQREGGAGDE